MAARPRSPTRSGNTSSAMTRPIRPGSTAIASSSRTATPRCCFTARGIHLASVKDVTSRGKDPRIQLVSHGRRTSKKLPPIRKQVPRPSRVSGDGPLASRRRTGPLGQGVATSVGMAMRPAAGWPPVTTSRASISSTSIIYVLCGDGDMQWKGSAAKPPPLPGPPQAVEPLLDLRQQPHHDRGQHLAAAFDEDRRQPASRRTAGTSSTSPMRQRPQACSRRGVQEVQGAQPTGRRSSSSTATSATGART